MCGTTWTANTGGEAKRAGNRCDNCYPTYRRAHQLYHSAFWRAKKKKLDFDLTVEWIESRILGTCARTGVDFRLEAETRGRTYRDRDPWSPSLDKINPAKGYTQDNVQVVCWFYNSTKQQFSDAEVLEYCKKVVDFSTTRDARIAEAQTP